MRVAVCANCGKKIVYTTRYTSKGDWLHPERGYSALCEEPKRGTPKRGTERTEKDE